MFNYLSINENIENIDEYKCLKNRRSCIFSFVSEDISSYLYTRIWKLIIKWILKISNIHSIMEQETRTRLNLINYYFCVIIQIYFKLSYSINYKISFICLKFKYMHIYS